MQKWSKNEEEFIVNNKGVLSHEDMAVRLGRTVSSINRKVHKLGITKKRTGSRLSKEGKKCSKCLLIKNENNFANNKTRLDGKESWCKSCRSFNLRESKYGISEEEYKMLFDLQHGQCEICRKSFESLCVDHCHITGKVRGLLCITCNWALGSAKDNPAILAGAILYLKKHGIKISTLDNSGSLTAEFLAAKNRCCGNGCKNCPY